MLVKEDSQSSEIVGHLTWKISIVSSLFLRQGGTITCVVSGSRSYSSDLPQGGLEVPCTIIFKIKDQKELEKIKSRTKTH